MTKGISEEWSPESTADLDVSRHIASALSPAIVDERRLYPGVISWEHFSSLTDNLHHSS